MDDWTAPLSALKQRPLTPTTAASSCGGSPRERNIADERRDISRHAGGSKFANKIAPASKGTDAHLAQAACAASPPEALVAYVRLEKRAHEMEIISRLAACAPPLWKQPRVTCAAKLPQLAVSCGRVAN